MSQTDTTGLTYTVTGSTPGKRRVEFSCPACSDVLKTQLKYAGEAFECPTCKRQLVVPGRAEFEAEAAAGKAERERQAAAVAAVAPVAAERPTLASIDYAAPQPADSTPAEPTRREARVPGHWFLNILGSILGAVGALMIVIGPVMMFNDRTVVDGIVLLFTGLLLLVAGMLTLILRALYHVEFRAWAAANGFATERP